MIFFVEKLIKIKLKKFMQSLKSGNLNYKTVILTNYVKKK